jgi:uncharacterized protein (TIGR00255 family)
MAIKSMTGFARSDGALGALGWHWEAKSVNGRGLDVRVRLAPGFEGLEPQVRDAVAKHLVRGSVSVMLATERREGVTEVRLNEVALAQVLKAAERISHLTGAPPPTAEGLLALKGVLEVVEPAEDAAEVEARTAAMLASLDDTLSGLAAARASEGDRLAAVLSTQTDEIARLVEAAKSSPARSAEAIGARLAEQVRRIVDTGAGLDPARLHQEAVLVATRADIAEEIERLEAHVAAARDLLGEKGAVGRKLDFLAQEFNREANTLCSKSNDVEITRIGLALKAVIDQMREQVQNIE